MNYQQYQPFSPVHLPKRQWPNRTITAAPRWCSVDLRDGNQSIPTPMNVEQKLAYFDMLVGIGFKEIEVGFPSASDTEFNFCRRLIEEKRIPDDVSIQILCQCREDLIKRSAEAIAGAKKVIFHIYNSTSPKQREYVFGKTQDEVVDIALNGVAWVKKYTAPLSKNGQDIQLQYSPESFTSTELPFAARICNAVIDAWKPTPKRKIIINLPATVEYATPNIHADQIEWMCGHLHRRKSVIVSLHTHNDRGTGVAATELGLLAGADRVEGTLFGNGERTGNCDLVTVALNMHTHGIDCGLDFSRLMEIRKNYESFTGMTVHERTPYAGDLVFTAFSGSHQDAIKKSTERQTPGKWDALYIPMNPADVGRDLNFIRVNSQSGKGGVAYILREKAGYELPRELEVAFGGVIKELTDKLGRELQGTEIVNAFESRYKDVDGILQLQRFNADPVNGAGKFVEAQSQLCVAGEVTTKTDIGNGPLDALAKSLGRLPQVGAFKVENYTSHSMGEGSSAQAAAYVKIKTAGKSYFGVATHTDLEMAPLRALISALNQAIGEAPSNPNVA